MNCIHKAENHDSEIFFYLNKLQEKHTLLIINGIIICKKKKVTIDYWNTSDCFEYVLLGKGN